MFASLSAELSAITSPTLLAKGRVNIIGLTEVRDQAAARWPRICDAVHARLESLLRSYLGTTDFFARIDDTTYIVTMPTGEADELNIVCLHALYDLHRDFLGCCKLGYIQIGRAAPGDGDTVDVTPLSLGQIGSLARKAGIPELVDSPNSSSQARAGNVALSEKRPSPNAVQIGENLIVERHFLPVWNAAHSAVLTYMCVPKSITMNERHLPLAYVPPSERVEIELACLTQGIEQLIGQATQRVNFLLGAQVSFEALGSPRGRRAFLDLCRNTSFEYRDYIAFILTEVPPGVAQSRLANMITHLKPYSRRVSATVAPHTRSFSAYHGIGVHAIGLDLQEYPRGDTSFEVDVHHLTRAARKARQRSFTFAIRDSRVLETMHEAGVQYLCGGAVLPACERPMGVRRLTWESLWRQTFFVN